LLRVEGPGSDDNAQARTIRLLSRGWEFRWRDRRICRGIERLEATAEKFPGAAKRCIAPLEVSRGFRRLWPEPPRGGIDYRLPEA
jgi:hypothetical protein